MIGGMLKSYFDAIIKLEVKVWENFVRLGKVHSHVKETILKQSQTTEKNFHFLLEGSGGNLVWHKNNFVCTDIGLPPEPLCDYVSFMTQKSSPIEVRLFEDSTVFQISYDKFQYVFQTGNYGEQVTRAALELAYKEKEQLQIDLLTKTAKERYLDLIAKNTKLEEIPLKYLASYLGITPQSLSRIRSGKT